jgi:hypothetical protein
MRPRERSSVYLNEHLVLHFSAELKSASVTPQSFRITTSAGAPAQGRRFVFGRELRFIPDAVRATDLSDGGYKPDTNYRVELAGFPRADALRASDGTCLATTLRIEFHTVRVESPRTGAPVFEDDSPDQGLGLRILGTRPARDGLIQVRTSRQGVLELEAEEPIDPSTLSMEDFSLTPRMPHGEVRSYPLRPELVENDNKHAFPPVGTTILRLVPQTLLPSGDYRLTLNHNGTHLRDFSSHLMPLIGLGPDGLRRLVVRTEDLEVAGEYWEEFLDAGMRSSALVPGADGTALWSNTGRLEVRYPAAAGDGSDGEVLFAEAETRSSVSATRLLVPEGINSRLDAGDGLCLLRSQGAMEIAGRLQRVAPTRAGPHPTIAAGETLSHWIERQIAADSPLTVLIAGGDLRISGHLEVPGPLLLVAGGRVRVSGQVRIADGSTIGPSFFLAKFGEGGAIALWRPHESGPGVPPKIEVAGLLLDPPLINPLVRPLVYAVRSTPIPKQGRALRWLATDGQRGRAGSGTLRVSYVGERRSAQEGGELEMRVDDPVLLVDCPTLRLLLELRVPAAIGEAWDPPVLDSVRVRWETEDSPRR